MIIKKNLDIIIPVYNEGELILDTINSIRENFEQELNIIICYDDDDDDTISTIKESNLEKKNLFFIKNPRNDY